MLLYMLITLETRSNMKFALKELGIINCFLEIRVEHTSESIHISCIKYTPNLMYKTKMQHVKPFSTTMINGLKLFGFGSDRVEDN